MCSKNPMAIGFEDVTSAELNQVNGGAIGLLGRIAVRLAAKAIVWTLDQKTALEAARDYAESMD